MEVYAHSQAEKVAARLKLVTAMQAGINWRTAVQTAELAISRTAAYRFLKNFKDKGEVALYDGRQGHPSKLKPPVQTWLLDYCRANPYVASIQLQVAIKTHFGVMVSVRRLNTLRAGLGITRSNQPKPLSSCEQAATQVKKKHQHSNRTNTVARSRVASPSR